MNMDESKQTHAMPLHTAKFVYTFNQIWKSVLSSIGLTNLSKKRIILMAVLFIVSILLHIITSLNGQRILAFIVTIYPIALAFAGLLILFMYISSRMEWKTNKFMQGTQVTFNFFVEEIEVSSTHDTLRAPYSKLYKMVETKTHFSFMISWSKGFPLPKENCTQDLQDFIRQKALEHHRQKKSR